MDSGRQTMNQYVDNAAKYPHVFPHSRVNSGNTPIKRTISRGNPTISIVCLELVCCSFIARPV
jgi:hypothetical protein